MLFNIVVDVAKLSLFIVCAYALPGACARRRRPQWTEHLTKRRLTVPGILMLAVSGIKRIDDVVAKESGPVDQAVLWFFRNHVPAALDRFFKVVKLSTYQSLFLSISIPRHSTAQKSISSAAVFELNLPTMTCGHCFSVVTKAIEQADPQACVEIDLASHRVRIETVGDREAIESAVTEAGYAPS